MPPPADGASRGGRAFTSSSAIASEVSVNGSSNGVKHRDAKVSGRKQKSLPGQYGISGTKKHKVSKAKKFTTFIVNNQIRQWPGLSQCSSKC